MKGHGEKVEHTTSESENAASKNQRVRAILDHLAHWLPTQAPIKDFIHHNTLHAFQNRQFHDALLVAAEIFGANAYLSLDEYQSRFQRGEISLSAMNRVLTASGIAHSEPSVEKRLLSKFSDQPKAKGFAETGNRDLWKRFDIDLNALIHPTLFRLVSNFLDQGVSIWRMPHAHRSFWEAVRGVVQESWFPIAPLSDRSVRFLLEGSPEAAIEYCLKQIVGSDVLDESYLLEVLLAHPGWSGMVRMVEMHPKYLLSPRRIALSEFVAVSLMLELGWLTRKFGKAFAPLATRFARGGLRPSKDPESMHGARTAYTDLQRLWHESLEWTYYEELLSALEQQGAIEQKRQGPPSVIAYFCIDDRECSLRRHLEEIDPTVATFGTAGFFGVDCLYQPFGSRFAFQHCPAPVTPKHLVQERSDSKPPRLMGSNHFRPSSNTLVRGWLVTQVVGLWSSIRMLVQVFRPGSQLFAQDWIVNVPESTTLGLLREEETPNEQGYYVGYSIAEMADRVTNVLKSSGCVKDFPNLMLFFGHGSSSANNPYFAAYNCGACSGQRGAPNARAFAWMLNHPEIRKELAKRGIVIPESTRAVGGVHDTSSDEVEFFDTEGLSSTIAAELKAFQIKLAEAVRRNALERCRRFELATPTSPEAAHQSVQNRARSIFEPRPEYNHATNVAAVVGGRDLTRGLFMDRRVFMNSYDPKLDKDGSILLGILRAVVPVCGGINLEYCFSRLDNSVYGAGTKLPQNVVGLIGVATGVEGDLRTGLPAQMVEIHDPLRLLIVVEQEPEMLLSVIQRDPAIEEWVRNGWVILASLSPSSKKAFFYKGGKFEPVFGERSARPALSRYLNSLAVARQGAGNLRIARVGA